MKIITKKCEPFPKLKTHRTVYFLFSTDRRDSTGNTNADEIFINSYQLQLQSNLPTHPLNHQKLLQLLHQRQLQLHQLLHELILLLLQLLPQLQLQLHHLLFQLYLPKIPLVVLSVLSVQQQKTII